MTAPFLRLRATVIDALCEMLTVFSMLQTPLLADALPDHS